MDIASITKTVVENIRGKVRLYDTNLTFACMCFCLSSFGGVTLVSNLDLQDDFHVQTEGSPALEATTSEVRRKLCC